MSGLETVKNKIMALMETGHYGREGTIKVLMEGSIPLHLQVGEMPEDGTGKQVDVALITQDDIDAIKGQRDDLIRWIKETVQGFCGMPVAVKVVGETTTSVTFQIQAASGYHF